MASYEGNELIQLRRKPITARIVRKLIAGMLLAIPDLMLAVEPTQPVGGDPSDSVFYAGSGTRFESAFRLSDGTLLVGGGATSLSWIPQGTPMVELGGAKPEGGDSGRTPFLLHLDADAKNILDVRTLPIGCAEDIASIRTTSVPGQPTGDIYIAGRVRKNTDGEPKEDGYFIARLDANYVSAQPSSLLWSRSVRATGSMRSGRLPWDVSADGLVIYACGGPYGYNWLSVEALGKNGARAVVPDWRRHKVRLPDNSSIEFAGTTSDAPGTPEYSSIVLKVTGRGDFRSWTEDDWRKPVSDGNGGVNHGAWPFDAMFPGPFDNATGSTVKLNDDGRGWYGYRWGRNPTACVGGIAIDRRDGSLFIGGNNQSRLPGGQPDFEPWVVAMTKTGALRWWTRLYPESKGVSTPDQYVDGLAIDYSEPLDREGGVLLVLARCHGNNVNNLWDGAKIKRAARPGFQPQFTGRHGNAHYGWLARMTGAGGDMLAATFIAEYAEGANHGGKTFPNPLIAHWPHNLSGWPDLNTTKVHALSVDEDGRACIVATGRRVITTRNAFQQMPSPIADPGKKGVWSDFARIYSKDLSDIDYSTILVGEWDWATESGNSVVKLADVLPVPGGVLLVGHAPVGKDGAVNGKDMPVRNVPVWGSATHSAEAGVLAMLHFAGRD